MSSEEKIVLKQLEKLMEWWEGSVSEAGLPCKSLLLSILSKSYRMAARESVSPEEQAIKPAVQYILKYYNEKITLQQLSREVGLTPSYFGKLFKAATGDSPITYVHRVRVEKAIELLGIGFTCNEIAAMVGFEDPFYFSKVFKKIVGLSPRAYLNSGYQSELLDRQTIL
ncbi:helix-turn-helix domain-containing protein [Paenibacillus sp. GXUN7292]|uniref:helix-turn-helix domain-containing protein n=1 Tax=Paenibacillus sp. GXUN7292 TaxID=3422499 RepID=UPI003D7E39B5